MKSIKPILFFTVILLGCISCKNKAGSTEQQSMEAGTEEIEDSVCHARGVVIEVFMNGFTMVTSRNDTLYMSTMDQDIALEGGLLLGDTLEVAYMVTQDEPGINIASAVTKMR